METRINKYLSEAGVCSRRAADKYIEEGRVTVDGVLAVMGTKVIDGQQVMVDGKIVGHSSDNKKTVLVLNKPRGIVCTCSDNDKDNVIDYIKYPVRVYPVGRLDKDSEGLLLLTNDGELTNAILKAANGHEKEYIVTVDKKITEEFLTKMANGVPVLDRITSPCRISKIDDNTFNIILIQGLNRQIRRMCEYLGYSVKKLRRIRIMNIKLGNLPIGDYREANREELDVLYKSVGMNN